MKILIALLVVYLFWGTIFTVGHFHSILSEEKNKFTILRKIFMAIVLIILWLPIAIKRRIV